ncbi:hypothetical protein D3C77_806910 [compost metagenome]
MLADGFLINVAQVWVTLAYDLAHAQLGQLFWQSVFLVEQAALQHGFVLQEVGHHFVQVFFADA